jgi:FAD/FMN-containing dehydrogenase
VVTARAGTRLAELEAVLAEQGQMLAFEPPHFSPFPAGERGGGRGEAAAVLGPAPPPPPPRAGGGGGGGGGAAPPPPPRGG